MNRRQWFVVSSLTAIVVGLSVAVYFKHFATPTCDPRAVAEQLLAAERPQMGPIERQFWLDVLTRHFEPRGVSVALVASLAAQENHFKSYRTSSAGALGIFQIMPEWRGRPQCPKDTNLFEVEAAAECAARILEYNLGICKGDMQCALRHYVSSPAGQAKAQWYADQIVTRLARATATCPAFQSLLVAGGSRGS